MIKLIGQGRLGSFKFFTLIATEVPAERVQQVAFYGEAFVDDDVADPPTCRTSLAAKSVARAAAPTSSTCLRSAAQIIFC